MPRGAPFGAAGDIATNQHAALNRAQVAISGLNRHALQQLIRRQVLTKAAPKVFVVHGAPATWQQRLSVAVLSLDAKPIVYGSSAARLHGLDGFADDETIEVAVPRGHRLRAKDVVVRQRTINPELLVEIGGFICTNLAETLCQIATTAAPDELSRALDDFQRRGLSLNWLEQTARSLHRPGQRGTKRILGEVEERRLLGRVCDSWFEKLVEQCLKSTVLPPLVRQYEIRTDDGQFVARADLAFPLVRLGIEAHSRQFHVGSLREAIDERRDNLVAAEGWELCYVGYADATQTPAKVRRVIEKIVARRASDLGIEL